MNGGELRDTALLMILTENHVYINLSTDSTWPVHSTGPTPHPCAFRGILYCLIGSALTDPRAPPPSPPCTLTPGSCVLTAALGCDVGMTPH